VKTKYRENAEIKAFGDINQNVKNLKINISQTFLNHFTNIWDV